MARVVQVVAQCHRACEGVQRGRFGGDARAATTQTLLIRRYAAFRRLSWTQEARAPASDTSGSSFMELFEHPDGEIGVVVV